MRKRYVFKKTYGSERFGPCEVCHKPVKFFGYFMRVDHRYSFKVEMNGRVVHFSGRSEDSVSYGHLGCLKSMIGGDAEGVFETTGNWYNEEHFVSLSNRV